ncbi:MAG: hypothetical protein EAZ85_04190 [Bacteroidetes bacterium]|nr:MAG: hypothetical protein EAZ85_04190 [Bacteroidota bacterium]TAG85826.1 MAG: hypothetical protein EAZ20_14130 [Bacteroidota bacterium]
MYSIIKFILNLGIDENLPQTQIIKVRIMNTAYLIILFSISMFLTYHIFFIIFDFKTYLKDIFPLTITNLILCAVIGVCLWLNYKKKYELSVLFNFSFICVYFMYIAYKTNNAELMYSFFSVFLIAFFVFNNKKTLIFMILIALLFFIMTKILLYFGWYEKDLNSPFIVIINTIISLVIFIIIGYLFKSENQKYIKTIEEQSKNLAQKNIEIETKSTAIAAINSLLTESIDYAGRIQTAILPTENQLLQAFPESFVYYLPKDIVSGDFYWLGEEENFIFWAVGDCTGHGVPGAMMSVLGMSFLTQIIGENKTQNPAEILNILDKKVLKLLSEDGKTNLRDGMDIALLIFDKQKKEVAFAAAQRPVWLMRNGELKTFKGSKIPVGSEIYQDKNFETHYINIEKNDILYVFSDGMTDQFDAKDEQKIGTPLLKNWITEIQSKPFKEQKNILKNNFQNWKQQTTQTDDVVFLGVKFT